MQNKIKRAIAILEANKLISSSQIEFCECTDLAIKALEMQYKMIEHCDKGCIACSYTNPHYSGRCMNNFVIRN